MLAFGLLWLGLGSTVSACVGKPAFHCKSDAACVSADGTKGTCEADGECTFHSTPLEQGGSSGTGENAGDSSTIVGGSSGNDAGGSAHSGGSGHAGSSDIGAAGDGDAGAPCTGGVNDCYSCTPTKSEQFLNACTSSACVPFDDHARVTKISASGELPPLPTPAGL
jgi:hypothetical protein